MSLEVLWDLLRDPEPDRAQQGRELLAVLSPEDREPLFADLFSGHPRRLTARVPDARTSASRWAAWLHLPPLPSPPASPTAEEAEAEAEEEGLWWSPWGLGGRWLHLEAGGLAAAAHVPVPASAGQVVPWLRVVPGDPAVLVGVWRRGVQRGRSVVQVILLQTWGGVLCQGSLHSDGSLRLRSLYLHQNLEAAHDYQRVSG